MKKLLVSGDTSIARYDLFEDGSVQLQEEKPMVRAAFSIPRQDGVFSIYEGDDDSAFLCLNRALETVDRVDITGTKLCHIYYAENVQTLYGSCYGTGHVIALGIEKNSFTGTRSSIIAGEGQEGTPRAHCCIASPDGRFLLTAAIDQDQSYWWRIAPDGSIEPNGEAPACQAPKGSGPRHLRFHPDGSTLYAVTEYSNEILVYAYAADTGALQLRQVISTLSPDFKDESFGSALLITQDGQRLYAANRGADTVALFSIAPDKTLTQLAQYSCGGHWPRHMEFTKDETMLLVANERSGSVTLQRVDADTGALNIIGQIPFDRPGFAAEWDEF